MGIELPPAMLERYVQKQDKVRGILQQIDYSVNNNQFAAAVAALCDPKSKRQFLNVPSVMSKIELSPLCLCSSTCRTQRTSSP